MNDIEQLRANLHMLLNSPITSLSETFTGGVLEGESHLLNGEEQQR